MRALLGVLVLALSVSCLAQSKLPAPSASKNEEAKSTQPAQQRANDACGTESSPIFVKSVPRPDCEANAREEKHERGEKAHLDWVLTWSTFWLALFTCFLFIFTGSLWWVTYRLSRDARNTSSEQQKALIAVQRAFVFPLQVQMMNDGQVVAGALMWTIRVWWENSGSTPAKNVLLLGSIQFAPSPSWVCQLPILSDCKPSKTYIGPKGKIHGGISISSAHIEASKAGAMSSIFYFGIVRYQDVFGGKRVTMVCYRINLNRSVDFNSQANTGFDVDADFVGEYCCTDEDCEKYSAFLAALPT